MSDLGFVNRAQEIELLGRAAAEVQGRHTFLFLCAPSGFGKSALVADFFRRRAAGLAVRVAILQRRGADGLDYMRHIVRAVDGFAARTGRFQRLSTFVRGDWSPRTKVDLLSRSLPDALRLAPGASALVPALQKAVGAEGLAAEASLLRESPSGQASMQGYLKAFFAAGGSSLSIENAQAIDERSMAMVEILVREAEPGFWILEHTEAADGHDARTLMDWAARAGAHVDRLDITALPWNDLSKALGIGGAISNIMRNQFDRSKGNLHEFLATKRHLDDRKGELGADELAATRRAIADLPPDRLMVFGLVAMHDGEVARDLLTRAVRSTPQLRDHVEGFLLDEALAAFGRSGLAAPRNEEVRVVHDSVLRAFFELDEAVPSATLAARVWMGVYKEALSVGDVFVSRADALSAVMFYALHLDDEAELHDALRRLTAESVAAMSPRRLEACVDRLFRRADATGQGRRQRLQDLAFHVVGLLVRVGAFAAAERLLPRLAGDSPAAQFYDAVLALESDRSDEALAKSRSLLSRQRQYRAGNLWKAANLVLLAALRMTNQPEEGARLYRALEGDAVFDGSPLRPHFLLLAGVALPAVEAVARVGEAVALFAGSGERHAENCARVTHSQCLSDLGRLAEAERALDGVAGDATMPGETFTLANNRAVLRIRAGAPGAAAVDLLRDAALMASDRFASLIIYINLMVANVLVGETGRAHDAAQTVRRILRDPEPQEFEIRRIAFHDLAWFYGQRGAPDEAAAMRKAAEEIPSRINQSLWDHRFGRRADIDPAHASRASLLYELPMFAYWSLDVASHLGS